MSKNPPEVKITRRDSLKPETVEMSEKVRKHLDINVKEKKVTVADEAYLQTLPEPLNKELLTTWKNHDRTFIAGAGLAVGEALLPVFKKHPDLDSMAVEFPTLMKDSIGFEVRRTQQVPIQNAAEGDPKTRTTYGGLTVKLVNHGAKGDVGQLRHVKAVLAEQYQDAFGKA